MRPTAILILILSTGFGFAQTETIRGQQFQLKGKIINEIVMTPGCGKFAWATVIEFEIVEFSDPEYKPATIAVIFTCPDSFKKEFFQLGELYSITISDQKRSDVEWIILNESVLKKYNLKKRLWVKTEKA